MLLNLVIIQIMNYFLSSTINNSGNFSTTQVQIFTLSYTFMYVRYRVHHEVICHLISLSIWILPIKCWSFYFFKDTFGSILWAESPDYIINDAQGFYWPIGTFCRIFCRIHRFFYWSRNFHCLASVHVTHLDRITPWGIIPLMNPSLVYAYEYVCNR